VGESFPLVYVRGFAGGQAGIDEAVNDPFYGFNDGATHVRVNVDGVPRFYLFESALLRLITDEGYRVLVHGDQRAYLNACPEATTESHVPHETLWVYRFYDDAASTFGAKPVGFQLLSAAQTLLKFVQLVLEKTGAEKVFLVAHSMGGLVARSMLQKVCPEADIDPTTIVDKFFTYATPHAGISFSPASFLNITVPEWSPSGLRSSTPRRCMATSPQVSTRAPTRRTNGTLGICRITPSTQDAPSASSELTPPTTAWSRRRSAHKAMVWSKSTMLMYVTPTVPTFTARTLVSTVR